jgi:hypothetical protein
MAQDGVAFVKDGPLIPVQLLQALEDGPLTVFAGAGVSRCCGLPDFKTLVTDTCSRLHRAMEPDEQSLFDRDAYDAALGVIEGRIGKASLRRTVSEILEIRLVLI